MTLTRRNHGLNHSYEVDGVKCRGVTTIIGATMPKGGLVKWAAETTADYALDNLAELTAMKPSQARKALLRARFDDRDQAANRGTQVHKLAVELAHGREVIVPDYLRGHVESYARWLDAEEIDPVATELAIANREVWYCGSVDLITPYRGAISLVDLTTSRSGVWFEKALQICAYHWAETYTIRAWDGQEKPMTDLGVETTGALWIRSDGCEYRPTRSDSGVWDYFRHLAWLHQRDEDTETWVGAPDDPAPDPQREDA